jgi:hypothetical protein
MSNYYSYAVLGRLCQTNFNELISNEKILSPTDKIYKESFNYNSSKRVGRVERLETVERVERDSKNKEPLKSCCNKN